MRDNYYYQGLFNDFIGREAALRQIKRYHIYNPMLYRSDDFTHSWRVHWMVKRLLPYATEAFGAAFDPEKALILALVHDDTEMIIGDIQAGNKVKMTTEQLAELDRQELEATNKMAERFPRTIGGYVYQELLQAIVKLETLEAQFVKFMDKMDAFGEALHEVHGGSDVFTKNVVNELGVIPTPLEYYTNFFAVILEKFPLLTPVVDRQPAVYFSPPSLRDFSAVARAGTPHNAESILQPTGYAHYDFWRETILAFGDQEAKRNLYEQKEF